MNALDALTATLALISVTCIAFAALCMIAALLDPKHRTPKHPRRPQ